MQYKIVISDTNGTSLNVRLKLPFFQSMTSEENSSWFADGGVLKYSSGTCDWSKDGRIGPTEIRLCVGKVYGVALSKFFDSAAIHNSGGTGTLYPGWGEKLVPGPITWVTAE